MAENEQPKCDVDDIVCQINVLSNLKALETSLGDDSFRQKYPEAAELRDKITDDIKAQGKVVSDGLAACVTTEESEITEDQVGEPVPED